MKSLRDVVEEVLDDAGWEGPSPAALVDAIGAWLTLPPSGDELEIAADLIAEWRQVELQHGPVHKTSIDNFIAHRVLLASRAVLVRPPEVEKEPSLSAERNIVKIKGRKNRYIRQLEMALTDQAAGRLDTATPEGVRSWAEVALRRARAELKSS